MHLCDFTTDPKLKYQFCFKMAWLLCGGSLVVKNAGSPAMTQKPNSSFFFKIIQFSKLRVMCQVKGWDQDHSLFFSTFKMLCTSNLSLSKSIKTDFLCNILWPLMGNIQQKKPDLLHIPSFFDNTKNFCLVPTWEANAPVHPTRRGKGDKQKTFQCTEQIQCDTP